MDKTYARIQAGEVAEIIIVAADGPALADLYDPSFVTACVLLTPAQKADVRERWLYDGHRFTAPLLIAPAASSRIMTPRAFRMRFTAVERGVLTLAASRSLEAGDATLQVFLDDLAASQEVDLRHPDLLAGMDAIVVAGLIDAARAAEILAA